MISDNLLQEIYSFNPKQEFTLELKKIINNTIKNFLPELFFLLIFKITNDRIVNKNQSKIFPYKTIKRKFKMSTDNFLGNLQAHVLDLIYYTYYGNKDSNTYEFDGLDKFISTNRTNQVRGGVTISALSTLDAMIDSSNRKGGARHKRAFLMSPEMLSKVSQLSGYNLDFTQVDIGGGWRLNAYRDIPIIETTSTRPVGTQFDSSDITLTSEGTQGSLSNGTYYVQIAPVTLEGEQLACDEIPITLSNGTATQRIKIDFASVYTNAAGEEAPLAYKIYVSQTTETETLVKIVSAFIYDSDGTIDGDNGVDSSIYITSLTPGDDVPTHMQSDVPLVATGGVPPEIVALIDFDLQQGLGNLIHQDKKLINLEIKNFTDCYIKSFPYLLNNNEKTSVWCRGLRVE